MPMVQVGIVRMVVDQRLVPMAMRVRFSGGIASLVAVLVMLVVDVRMLVFQRLVLMGVLVPLGEV